MEITNKNKTFVEQKGKDGNSIYFLLEKGKEAITIKKPDRIDLVLDMSKNIPITYGKAFSVVNWDKFKKNHKDIFSEDDFDRLNKKKLPFKTEVLQYITFKKLHTFQKDRIKEYLKKQLLFKQFEKQLKEDALEYLMLFSIPRTVTALKIALLLNGDDIEC